MSSRQHYRRPKTTNFPVALEALLKGKKIRRACWAQNMCLEYFVRNGDEQPMIWIHTFAPQYSAATSGRWSPSQSDLTAYDWLVFSYNNGRKPNANAK